MGSMTSKSLKWYKRNGLYEDDTRRSMNEESESVISELKIEKSLTKDFFHTGY